jgi:hypothetical protein
MTPGATFRALLIGADFYFPNRTSGGELLSLSGCVHDVAAVETMLRGRVTLPLSIETLTSTRAPDGAAPIEPEERRPTYANIRAALERLAAEAQEGDVVLLYYAGHGARIRTRFEDLKKPSGFDEALVPIDIANRSTRYIRDLDLAFILQQLVAKKTVLTVVLDSCHSGGATRGTAVSPRCATRRPYPGAIDTTERPAGGFAPDDALRTAYDALRATGALQRDGRTGRTWLPSSKGYVLLAACLETQAALEASVDGRQHMGVLTGAWLDALRDLGTDQSWKTVFERTVRRMEDAGFRDQTPVLLGDEHREVLGARLRAPPRTHAEVDEAIARFRGLFVGCSVELAPRPEPASAWTRAAEETALSAVRTALERRGQGLVTEAGRGETPTFRVELDEQARYVITSADGQPLTRLPRLESNAEDAAVLLVGHLVHLARYNAIARITSPASTLEDEVEVTLLDDHHTPLSPGELGRYLVPTGTFHLRIANGSSSHLFVGILDLQSNWEIVSLWPPDDGTAAFELCAAREVREFPLELSVPEGMGSVVDRLKVIMTTSPASYRGLTLPPPGARGDAPGARPSVVTDTPWCVHDFWLDIHAP